MLRGCRLPTRGPQSFLCTIHNPRVDAMLGRQKPNGPVVTFRSTLLDEI
jgi:hypothetical protein